MKRKLLFLVAFFWVNTVLFAQTQFPQGMPKEPTKAEQAKQLKAYPPVTVKKAVVAPASSILPSGVLKGGVQSPMPILYESFENATLPSGWTTNSTWDFTNGSYPSAWNNYSIFSEKGEKESLATNSLLITPQLAISNANYAIEFMVYNSAEEFNVLVSTTNTQLSSFTVLNSTINKYDGFKQVSIRLAAYSGQNIYIAFQHKTTSENFNWSFVVLDDIIVKELLPNNLAIEDLNGNTLLAKGKAYNYTVNVINRGLTAQSTYTVKLMKASGAGLELASATGTPIAGGETKEFSLSWTPSTAEKTTVYAVVQLTADEYLDNNTTSAKEVTVFPEGSVFIGEGMQPDYNPYNFWYGNSLAQNLYLSSEINKPAGTIQSITYQNDFENALSNKAVKIWMGETTKQDLGNGWIDPNTLTKVFDGNIDFPAGENNIQIEITPYQYNGGNLVVYSSSEFFTDYSSGSYFYGTNTNEVRSRVEKSDYDVLNPSNPGGLEYQNISSFLPNIALAFSSTPVATGTISGVITDATTLQRISGVKVQIEGRSTSVVTNALGEYTLSALQAGAYNLNVSKQSYQNKTLSNVTVTANQTSTQNIQLAEKNEFFVSGHIYDNSNGMPIEGVTVTLMLGKIVKYTTTSNADGYYEFLNVLRGDYEFVFEKSGYNKELLAQYINEDIVEHNEWLGMLDYYITGYAFPDEVGWVDGSGGFEPGSTVVLLANVQNEWEYEFSHWENESETIVSIENPFIFTAAADVEYTAVFTLRTYAVALSANPTIAGTVEFTGSNTTGTFTAAETAYMKATPTETYQFVNWTYNNTNLSSTPEFNLEIWEDMEIVANFKTPAQSVYTINATVNDSKMGYAYGTGTYISDQQVALIADSQYGYKFVNWTKNGNIVSTNNNYEFTATENAIYVANFEKIPTYTIALMAVPVIGGEVFFTSCSSYQEGETAEFSAGETVYLGVNENMGYEFVNWTKNGNVVSTDSYYNFTATENATYVATFREITSTNVYDLTFQVNDDVTDTPIPNVTVALKQGGVVAFSDITNATGEVNFTNIPEGVYTVTYTHADYETKEYPIIVNLHISDYTTLQPIMYTITTNVNPVDAGFVNFNGNLGPFLPGAEVNVLATANGTNIFVNWTVGNQQVSTTNPYTFTATKNIELTANFRSATQSVYNVDVQLATAGTGTVTGSGSYVEGNYVTVLATPSAGHVFVNWTVNGEHVTDSPSHSFTVSENMVYVANFAKLYNVSLTVNPANAGTVKGTGEFVEGSNVTIKATNKAGYKFTKWTSNGDSVSNTATYTFAITQDTNFVAEFVTVSKNANLASLTASKGTLTPAFNADTLEYKVKLDSTQTNIMLTAVADHLKATIDGDGDKTLEYGANVFEIKVTAEDRVTTKTYKVTVVRGIDLGIRNTNTKEVNVKVYPNPTTGIVTIETENDFTPTVEIYNTNGMLLQKVQNKQVDMSAYPTGVYFIHVNGKAVKIIKK